MKKCMILFTFIYLFMLVSCKYEVYINDENMPSNQYKFEAPLDISGCIFHTFGNTPTIYDENIIKLVMDYYCEYDLYLVDDWELDLNRIFLNQYYSSYSLNKFVGDYTYKLFACAIFDDYLYIVKCDHFAALHEGCISHTYRSLNKIDRTKFINDIENIVGDLL